MGLDLKNIKDKVSQKMNETKEKVSQKLDETFVSSKTYTANPSLIPVIANKIQEHFQKEGYEVRCDNNGNNYSLFLTKGDIFKTIAGLKTGLVVNIKQTGDNQIDIISSIDSYKERGAAMAAGAAASLLALPLAIPSIIGAVKQAHLDEKPIEIASDVILNSK